MCPEPPHYVPGTVLSSQPGGSKDGRESRPSLRTGPSALGSAAGRPHWAPAPLGSTAVLWPGQPWPRAEHMGALGPGCFHPMLGSRGNLCSRAEELAEVCSHLQCSLKLLWLPAPCPPNFCRLYPQMNSLHSPPSASHGTPAILPPPPAPPDLLNRLPCNTSSQTAPGPALALPSAVGLLGGASLMQRVHGRMSENPAISAQ